MLWVANFLHRCALSFFGQQICNRSAITAVPQACYALAFCRASADRCNPLRLVRQNRQALRWQPCCCSSVSPSCVPPRAFASSRQRQSNRGYLAFLRSTLATASAAGARSTGFLPLKLGWAGSTAFLAWLVRVGQPTDTCRIAVRDPEVRAYSGTFGLPAPALRASALPALRPTAVADLRHPAGQASKRPLACPASTVRTPQASA